MKLTHLAALAILAVPSAGQTPAPTCDGVPPPAPLLDVVTEPNAPRYSGTCLEGEACELPEEWDTREFLPDGSVRHTFNYVGEARAVERGGTWATEVLEMAPTGKPGACWAWQWRAVP